MRYLGFVALAVVAGSACGCESKDTREPADRAARADRTVIADRPAPGAPQSAGVEAATRLTAAKSAAAQSATASAPENPVLLGSFRWRDHTVRVYAGRCYTVEDATGNVVDEYMTESEFADGYPQISKALREALASDAAWAGTPPQQDR